MPPIRPPTWPPHEMFGIAKLITRLITISVIAFPPRRPVRLPLEDQHRAEDPEDRAGGAEHRRRRRLEQRAGRAGQARGEVEADEARPAEVLLDRAAEPPQARAC